MMMNQTSYWMIRNFFQTNIGCSWKRKRILNSSWNQLLGNLISFSNYIYEFKAQRNYLEMIFQSLMGFILIYPQSVFSWFLRVKLIFWFIRVQVLFWFLCVKGLSSLCTGFIFCVQVLSSLCTGLIFSVYRFLSSLCTGFIFSVYWFYLLCVQVLPYLCRFYLQHVWFSPCNCKGVILYMYMFFPIYVQVLSSQCTGFICIAPCFDVRRI